MNEQTHFFMKIYLSHFILEKVWEMGGETYTQREDFFPYLLPRARRYQRLHPLVSSAETTSVRLRVPRSTAILCTLSKSHRVVLITWSPSGYTPAVPDRAVLFNIHMTACQSTLGHLERTENPCYITVLTIAISEQLTLGHYLLAFLGVSSWCNG